MSLEKQLKSKIRSQRRYKNLRFKFLSKISRAMIHGIFVLINLIVFLIVLTLGHLWLLFITLSLWKLIISIKTNQERDIVNEVMSAKTSGDFKKFIKKYDINMNNEIKQAMRGLDKLTKKVKRSK